MRLNLWLFLRIINITNWKGINGMRETRTIEFKETITNTFLKNSKCLFKLQWRGDLFWH